MSSVMRAALPARMPITQRFSGRIRWLAVPDHPQIWGSVLSPTHGVFPRILGRLEIALVTPLRRCQASQSAPRHLPLWTELSTNPDVARFRAADVALQDLTPVCFSRPDPGFPSLAWSDRILEAQGLDEVLH